MGMSNFQQATIEKIVDLYKNKTKVLCADEAGLGKTFVARGVIEALAQQKRASVGSNINGYKTFFQGLVSNYATFIRNTTSKTTKDRIKVKLNTVAKLLNYEIEFKNRYCNKFKNYIDTLSEEKLKKAYGVFAKCAKELTVLREGNKRKINIPIPKELPEEPFRVLYICCNLAIAQQNADKLSSIKQCHDDCDRLSLVWYYLNNYPTPYIDIYPITSTIVSRNTKGTEYERKVLGIKELAGETLEEKRPIAEKRSLEKLNPDLIIFDEFQNFGHIVKIINGEKITESDNTENYKYERLQKICSVLYGKDKDGKAKNPKTLLLSATPFHYEEGTAVKSTQLSYKDIITFLSGDSNIGITGKRLMDNGFLRSERAQLMSADGDIITYEKRFKKHFIECDYKPLIPVLSKLKTAIDCTDSRIVTLVPQLLMSTPYLWTYQGEYKFADEFKENSIGFKYEDNILYWNKDKTPVPETEHDKYLQFERIVCSRSHDLTDNAELSNPSMLLWIPPTGCKDKLGGVFKAYADYSKTLVFSNYTSIPPALCDVLNARLELKGCTIDKDTKEALYDKQYLKECFSDVTEDNIRELMEKFIKMLEKTGGNALGDKPSADTIINYCKEGCLKQTIKEYYEICKARTNDEQGIINEFNLTFDYIINDNQTENENRKFAVKVDATILECSDKKPTFRRNFNSPFRPFTAVSTSVGTEGLDFHSYCCRIIHYNHPKNPIEYEQKNGRIDRYNSLAVRRYCNENKISLDTENTEKSGISPNWNSGEENMHLYFLHYPEFISEEKAEINRLIDWVEKYRDTMGEGSEKSKIKYNLSPYCHKKK